MDLTIYAAEVGICTLEELDVSNELNVAHTITTSNPDYEPAGPVDDNGLNSEKLKVYDVLLAGVRSHG